MAIAPRAHPLLKASVAILDSWSALSASTSAEPLCVSSIIFAILATASPALPCVLPRCLSFSLLNTSSPCIATALLSSSLCFARFLSTAALRAPFLTIPRAVNETSEVIGQPTPDKVRPKVTPANAPAAKTPTFAVFFFFSGLTKRPIGVIRRFIPLCSWLSRMLFTASRTLISSSWRVPSNISSDICWFISSSVPLYSPFFLLASTRDFTNSKTAFLRASPAVASLTSRSSRVSTSNIFVFFLKPSILLSSFLSLSNLFPKKGNFWKNFTWPSPFDSASAKSFAYSLRLSL